MKNTKPVLRLMATASLLCVCGMSALAQQSVQTPSEMPPASFAGTQYVDSTGCAFIRAGIGDMVKWVPRVTRDRRQVCGFQPTFSVRQANVPTKQIAQPKVVPTNITAVMALTELVVVSKKPAPSVTVVSQPIKHSNSKAGTIVTPGNTAAKGVSGQTRVLPRHVYEDRREMRPVKTPKNFVPAWKDDRLNPRRAEQTLQGHQQMQKVWTNTLPRRLVD